MSNPLAGGEGGERLAVSLQPVGPVDLPGDSGQAALLPAVLEVSPDMSAFLLEGVDEAGFSADDGVEQNTGEFIDAGDPQAYAAYWDGLSDGVVRDTGEFIAVDAGRTP